MYQHDPDNIKEMMEAMKHTWIMQQQFKCGPKKGYKDALYHPRGKTAER